MNQLSRREFLTGLFALGVTLSFSTTSKLFAQPLRPNYYPPRLMGLRGSHESAYKYAHQMAFEHKSFVVDKVSKEQYDLIVVGAGISGLSAAYFYLKEINSKARILILDNHDDFGGHAKRNEFHVNGKTLLAYGGTQSFDTVSEYSRVSKELLEDLGIKLDKFESYYDKDFFEKHEMTSGIFCSRETFETSKLVQSALPANIEFRQFSNGYMPYLKEPKSFEEVIDELPLSQKNKEKLHKIVVSNKDYEAYDASNYVDFLKEAFDVDDRAVTDLLSMILCEDSGIGGKAIPTEVAHYAKFLGVSKKNFFSFDDEKYIHHFPDGNATLVRLLVQKLIPKVASFSSVEESILTGFDYATLDRNSNQVNIRLNAFVNSIKNVNNKTHVQYMHNDQCIQVEATHTIMAGWHSVASYVVKELPKKQKALLRANLKMPLIYVQVALNNWEFLKKAGVATTYCPSSYFQFVNIDFPIKIGNYQAIETPNKPLVLTMIRIPTPTNSEDKIENLLRMGRYEALGTSLETFDNHIKSQLEEMFSSYGFDYARDVHDRVINRWGHGYTYEGALSKSELKEARKPVQNIFFANADSAGAAYSDAAIDMAYKAIKEIKKRKE